MPRSPKSSDPVREILEEAESDLSRRLREACEAESRGVSSNSAAEIRHLEDTLLAAALAAERTLAARKHLRTDESQPAELETPSREPEHGSDARASGTVDSDSSATAVREFEDESGRAWRAWPVTPGQGRPREGARLGLGDFQGGWICFEALDNSGRRRLPRHEPRWSDLPPEELNRLLAQALDAPGRASRNAGGQQPDGP